MIVRAAILSIVLHVPGLATPAQPPDNPTSDLAPLDVNELLQRLDSLRSEPVPAPGSADQIDALLGQLIVRSPNDDRCATWMVDRAALRLARLAADTSDLSVMLGIPTRAQRRNVGEGAAAALAQLAQARIRADESVRRLESGLMGTGVKDAVAAASQAAAVEARLSTLVDLEQTQRIPFHEAWAQSLIAASAESGDRVSALNAAAKSLALVRLGSPAGESARQALLASTLHLASGGQNAAANIKALIEQARAGAPDSTTRLRLAMLAAMLETPDHHEPAPSTQVLSTGERLLLAEARARALLEVGRPGAPGWNTRVARACTVLLEAKDSSVGPNDPDASALRLLIYAKIAQIIDPTVPAAQLPAEALFGRAVALAAEDSSSREVGMLFDLLIARADLAPPLRADVLWEAGVHVGRQTNEADKRCPLSFVPLVTEFPKDPRSPQAAWNFIERCGCAAAASGSDSPVDPATCERLVQFALDHPIAGIDPAVIDRWRAELLRLIWNRCMVAGWSREQIDRVLRLWSDLSPAQSAKIANLTGPRRLLTNMDQRGWSGIDASARLGVEEAALSWAIDIERRDVTIGAAADVAAIRLRIGESKVGLGRKDAAGDLQALVGSAADAPGSPDRGRFRVLLGRALRLSGESESAAAALRAFTDEFDAPGPGSVTLRPAAYWQAWAEMLEMQAAANADGSKTAPIDAQIKRLELIDPSLGGDPGTADRIRAALKPAR